MAVFTAPARIRKPTTTTKTLRAKRSSIGPATFMARPLMRFSPNSLMRTSLGMSNTARKLKPPVKIKL